MIVAALGGAVLVLEKFPQSMGFSALQNVRQMLVDNATIPMSVIIDNATNTDDVYNQEFPYAEGLLNLEFLGE